MKNSQKERHTFSGKIGFVLAAAGASVGLGNIWRFPYLAAKYGGGIFILAYIILAVTFGYTMIIAETSIGRMTRKSPVGAFRSFGNRMVHRFGGWLNAIIPLLIVPYYCTIGGWVLNYLWTYITGHGDQLVAESSFTNFISNGARVEIFFIIFAVITLCVVIFGVQGGIERVSKVMMPILIVLAMIVAIFSMTREGAMEGIQYLLVPNLEHFSLMTIVSAMGQMFYSLSIAMGILMTFGSYMKKEISIEKSTLQVEIFDSGIAIMAGLMIIPAVFAFSDGNPNALSAGPSLMFETMPKIFANMSFGSIIGLLFFVLVAFAALTSSIALTESAVSTFEDEFGWNRKKTTCVIGMIIIIIGSFTSLGYGPLASLQIFGMQLLDFFDFITNSIMMPIAALIICYVTVRYVGLDNISKEMKQCGHQFKMEKVFRFMIQYACPIFVIIILISSIANVFGFIHI